DRGTISVGETATLMLSFIGSAPKTMPQPPEVAGLVITATGQSQQFMLVNGKASFSVSLSYSIQARQPGDYTIPSFVIETDGGKQNTPPVQLKVVPRGAATPQGSGLEQLAFVRLNSPRKECFIGEIFPVEIQLFFAAGRDIQMPNLRCEGFTVGKMVTEQATAPVNGTLYNLIRFRTLVTPVKTGKLPLGPAECQLMVQVRAQDFFGYRLQQYSPQSDAVEINVLPLPDAGKPADFAGAVGKYQMSYLAAPTNVQAGDPITVKIQITGQGALDQVQLPPFDQWRDFKTYPPTVKVDMFDPLSVMGIKNFEQVVLPQNAEVKELPSVAFSFFDPEAKTYRTVRQPGIPITVRPGGAGPQQPTVVLAGQPNAQNPPPPATDIVHIKPQLGAVAPLRAPLVMQPWFLALQAVPLAAWLGLVAWRKREDNIANNPRLRRQREVARVIESGLDELRRHAGANEREKFFATLFRLLQEQLGERLDLPASAITEAIVDERLQPAGLKEDETALLRELFELCNQARFAGASSGESLAVLVPKVDTVLERLKKLEVAR
ncbi:MAG: protein BatD, partial [Verrucomicrobia bacterium]|nr:protein BatD [Verrucomicrobiota bacterium]